VRLFLRSAGVVAPPLPVSGTISVDVSPPRDHNTHLSCVTQLARLFHSVQNKFTYINTHKKTPKIHTYTHTYPYIYIYLCIYIYHILRSVYLYMYMYVCMHLYMWKNIIVVILYSLWIPTRCLSNEILLIDRYRMRSLDDEKSCVLWVVKT